MEDYLYEEIPEGHELVDYDFRLFSLLKDLLKNKYIKKAPAWIVTLDAAQSWGVGPWKLEGGTKTLWYARYSIRRSLTIDPRGRI